VRAAGEFLGHSMTSNSGKILLPGGAGLVGQNLVARLRARGYTNLVVLDKHRTNLEILRRVQPDVVAEYADLAEPGDWARHFEGAEAVVMLQAQIGGPVWDDFQRNNIDATRHILDAIRAYAVPYLVHIRGTCKTPVARVIEVASVVFTRQQEEGVGGQLWQDAIV
jgi:nucleoside-diphosphate-sugar epimerase